MADDYNDISEHNSRMYEYLPDSNMEDGGVWLPLAKEGLAIDSLSSMAGPTPKSTWAKQI